MTHIRTLFDEYSSILRSDDIDKTTLDYTLLCKNIQKQIIKASPANDEDWVMQGQMYFILQKYEDAINCFSKVNPANGGLISNARLFIAMSKIELQKYEDAINIAGIISKDHVDYPKALYVQGLAYVKLRRHQQAIEMYNAAIKAGYCCDEIFYKLGQSYFALEQYDNAFASYKKTIKTDGTPTVYHKKSLQGCARVYWAKATAVRDELTEDYNDLEKRWDGLVQQACMYWDKAVKIDPYYNRARNGLGLIEISLGDMCFRKKNYIQAEKHYEAAIKVFEYILSYAPGYRRTINNLACAVNKKWLCREKTNSSISIRVRTGELSKLLTSLSEIVKDKNVQGELFETKGQLCAALEYYEEAIDAFDAAIAMKPKMAQAYVNKFECQKKYGYFDNACKTLIRAKRLFPNNYQVSEKYNDLAGSVNQLKLEKLIKEEIKDCLLSDIPVSIQKQFEKPTHYECGLLCKEIYKSKQKRNLSEGEWTLLKESSSEQDQARLRDIPYFAAAYSYKRTGIIVFVHKGTDFTNKKMLNEDIKIASGEIPSSTINLAQKFVADVIHEYKPKKVIHTGHSLGGFIAEYFSVTTGVPAVTFESPGCAWAINKNKCNVSPSSVQNITSYLSTPNPINVLSRHYGMSKYVIPVIGRRAIMKDLVARINEIADFFFVIQEVHSIDNILSFFDPDTGLPYLNRSIAEWPSDSFKALSCLKVLQKFDWIIVVSDNRGVNQNVLNELEANGLKIEQYSNRIKVSMFTQKGRDIVEAIIADQNFEGKYGVRVSKNDNYFVVSDPLSAEDFQNYIEMREEASRYEENQEVFVDVVPMQTEANQHSNLTTVTLQNSSSSRNRSILPQFENTIHPQQTSLSRPRDDRRNDESNHSDKKNSCVCM